MASNLFQINTDSLDLDLRADDVKRATRRQKPDDDSIMIPRLGKTGNKALGALGVNIVGMLRPDVKFSRAESKIVAAAVAGDRTAVKAVLSWALTLAMGGTVQVQVKARTKGAVAACSFDHEANCMIVLAGPARDSDDDADDSDADNE